MGLTAVAVLVGARAANAAVSTYNLESAPVIFAHQTLSIPAYNIDVPLMRVAAAGATRNEGIELRKPGPNDSGPEPHPPRPFIYIELTNIGRSPAADVRVPCVVTARMLVKALDPEALRTTTQTGAGILEIAGLGSQQSIIIKIENALGDATEIVVAPEGGATQADWRDSRRPRRRRPIAVVAEKPFSIRTS